MFFFFLRYKLFARVAHFVAIKHTRVGVGGRVASTVPLAHAPFVRAPYRSWEDTSLLCQVESEASLQSWAPALDEAVDLRPQQTELDRAKVDIELKAKQEWTSREEGIWGGL